MKVDHRIPADKGSSTSMWSMLALCLVVGAFAAYFLIFQESLNLSSIFLILILLACPLMHLFMHRGHGTH